MESNTFPILKNNNNLLLKLLLLKKLGIKRDKVQIISGVSSIIPPAINKLFNS